MEIQFYDLAGNPGSDTSASIVIDYTSPEPVITANPVPAKEGSLVAFNSKGSRDISGIASRVWSFPDGSSSTEVVAVHAFADGPTTQPVKLTITDLVGLTESTSLPMPVLNVSPTVVLAATSDVVRGIVPLSWQTIEPGSEDAPTVTIVARDLKSPIQTELAAGSPDRQAFDWDSRLSKETLFQLLVTVRDKDGGEGVAASNPILVDNHPLAIKTAGAKPSFFNPHFGEATDLAYSLSEHAIVTVRVIRATGATPIATLASNLARTEGTFSSSWDGKDATTGQVVEDGQYGYVVEGTDLLGNRVSRSSVDAGLVVIVDTVRPAPPVVTAPPALTRHRFLVLEGTKEPGSGIAIQTGTTVIAQTAPDDASTWSVATPLKEGANQLSVFAKDRAGNVSDATCPARPPGLPGREESVCLCWFCAEHSS